jgi:hypothetical protein
MKKVAKKVKKVIKKVVKKKAKAVKKPVKKVKFGLKKKTAKAIKKPVKKVPVKKVPVKKPKTIKVGKMVHVKVIKGQHKGEIGVIDMITELEYQKVLIKDKLYNFHLTWLEAV